MRHAAVAPWDFAIPAPSPSATARLSKERANWVQATRPRPRLLAEEVLNQAG